MVSTSVVPHWSARHTVCRSYFWPYSWPYFRQLHTFVLHFQSAHCDLLARSTRSMVVRCLAQSRAQCTDAFQRRVICVFISLCSLCFYVSFLYALYSLLYVAWRWLFWFQRLYTLPACSSGCSLAVLTATISPLHTACMWCICIELARLYRRVCFVFLGAFVFRPGSTRHLARSKPFAEPCFGHRSTGPV